jgi:hypothetical protein
MTTPPIDPLLRDLETLRDESRLQRHLLALDMRDRLDALDRRHVELHDSVRSARDTATDSVRAAAVELREAFLQFRDDAAAAMRTARH